MKIQNNSNCSFLGKRLIAEIYKTAERLYADEIVVNEANYNRYAEVELFEDGNCIDWHYRINVRQEDKNMRKDTYTGGEHYYILFKEGRHAVMRETPDFESENEVIYQGT